MQPFIVNQSPSQTAPVTKTATPAPVASNTNAASNALAQNNADYLRIFGSLPPALAPGNAGQINQAGQPVIPNAAPSYGNPTPAYAATQGAQTNIDLQIKQQQDAAAQAKAQSDALTANNSQAKGYLSTLMGSNPAQDARTAAQAQTGINPTNYYADQQSRITAIGELQKDYNATKAAMDTAVAAAQQNDNGQLTGAVNANVSRIQKAYATQLSQKSADINAQSAVLQALQGNFASAQAFTTQAVNDATADQKYKVDLLKTFIDQNNTEISKLDTKYQNAITTSYTMAKDEYTQARQEANDKVDNALKAAQTQALGVANASGVKLTPTQLNQGASSLGLSTTDYRALDPGVQTFFTSPGGKTFLSAIADVKAGKSTYDDVKSSIDSSVQPVAVKTYLQTLLDKEVPQTSGGGFFDKLGSWFNSLTS